MVSPSPFRCFRRALVARVLTALVAVAILVATPDMHATPGDHVQHSMMSASVSDTEAGLHAGEKKSPVALVEADCVGAHCAACAAVPAAAVAVGSAPANRPVRPRYGTDLSRVPEPHYRPPISRFPNA